MCSANFVLPFKTCTACVQCTHNHVFLDKFLGSFIWSCVQWTNIFNKFSVTSLFFSCVYDSVSAKCGLAAIAQIRKLGSFHVAVQVFQVCHTRTIFLAEKLEWTAFEQCSLSRSICVVHTSKLVVIIFNRKTFSFYNDFQKGPELNKLDYIKLIQYNNTNKVNNLLHNYKTCQGKYGCVHADLALAWFKLTLQVVDSL